MDLIIEHLIKAIFYAFKRALLWLGACRSSPWPLASGTVTATPTSSEELGCPTVEIVYSYRVKGELYTGLHEEPFVSTDALTDYVERLGRGKSIVVRVKPDNPEVSVVCERDQGAARSELTI